MKREKSGWNNSDSRSDSAISEKTDLLFYDKSKSNDPHSFQIRDTMDPQFRTRTHAAVRIVSIASERREFPIDEVVREKWRSSICLEMKISSKRSGREISIV